MYKLIGTRASRAFRVLWMLEELGQPYEHLAVPPHSDVALEFNFSGKVPVLVSDGVAIPDSVAIISYLADKHGMLTHLPGTLDRARQDGLTFRILDELDAPLWAAARHSFVLPEKHREAAIKPAMIWEYERNLAGISAALVDPFLMGTEMTLPDILLTHCLRWAEIAKFPEPDENLVAYKTRMEARDAFQKVLGMR